MSDLDDLGLGLGWLDASPVDTKPGPVLSTTTAEQADIETWAPAAKSEPSKPAPPPLPPVQAAPKSKATQPRPAQAKPVKKTTKQTATKQVLLEKAVARKAAQEPTPPTKAPAAPAKPAAKQEPTPPTKAPAAAAPATDGTPLVRADGEIAVQVKDLHVTFEVLADKHSIGRGALVQLVRSREVRHVAALRGISLTLHTGDALGLIGHNGAGKSTLMHTIAGFIQPSTGSVHVRSQPQMLGVKATLNQRLSGRANIRLGLLALGIAADRVPELVEDIAAETKLGSFIDLPVKTYSTGMRLRLGFAISTVRAPDILIIDEALAVGDKQFKKQSLDRLNEIRDSAGVVILASHSLNEIRRTCNRVIWMDSGRIVMSGPPTEVLPLYREAKLGTPDS